MGVCGVFLSISLRTIGIRARLIFVLDTHVASFSPVPIMTKSQTSPKCSVMDKIHWDPQTVVSNRNVNYQIPNNPRNITTLSNEQELDSTIMMSFRFRDGDIDTTNFNFQSFGTMFGALGGWW